MSGKPLPKTSKRALRRRTVKVRQWQCVCQRCGWEWATESNAPPARCARCKAPNWQAAPRWRRPDRSKSLAKE